MDDRTCFSPLADDDISLLNHDNVHEKLESINFEQDDDNIFDNEIIIESSNSSDISQKPKRV